MMLPTMERAFISRLREVFTLAVVAMWWSTAGAVGLVYVDAYDNLGAPPGSPYTNTIADQNFFAVSGTFDDAVNAYGTEEADFEDGKWGYRSTGFASEGTIYETAGESAPEIYQVISGLTPNAFYDVYVAYWSANNTNWAIRAGTQSNPGANPIFDRAGTLGTQGYTALYSDFDVLPKDNYTDADDDDNEVGGQPVLTQTPNAVLMEGNRYMLLGPAALNYQANAAGEIRIYIDDADGPRAFFDGLAYAPAGTAIGVYAEVDRTTGNLTLHNPTDQDFQVARLGINSASSSLDPREWITIAGNTDANGNMSRDTDAWTVTNPNPANATPRRSGQLREIEVADSMTGLDSNGAVIPANSTIDLGNVWIRSPHEDIVFEMATLLNNAAGGSVSPSLAVRIPVRYVGGTQLAFGDFDYDSDIDLDDYETLLTNLNNDFTFLTGGDAYFYGDMTGDRRTNFADIVAFAAAYDGFNGAGAFAAMTGVSVPEPATLLLLALCGCGIALRRMRRLAFAALLPLCVASTAMAQNVVYIDAEPANTVLENGGAFDATPTTGNIVVLPTAGSGTDQKWHVRNFGNRSQNAWVNTPADTLSVFEAGTYRETPEGPALSESVDRLITTVPVASGLYQVYGFYWDDHAGDVWDIDFQLGDAPRESFAANDGKSVEAASFTSITGISVTLTPGTSASGAATNLNDDGNRNMFAAPLGNWSTHLHGTDLRVAVDSSDRVANARTWYDGIGYVAIEEPHVVIEVNRSTGEVVLSNRYATPIEFSYYEILSESGSLDKTAWNSLDSQNRDAMDGADPGSVAGDSLLEGWDESGSDYVPGDFNVDGAVDAADYTMWRNGFESGEYTISDYLVWKGNYGETFSAESVEVLSESFLLGTSLISPGSTISLGNIYNTELDGRDLEFNFGTVADGILTPSYVFYTGSAPGALVSASSAVPEPSTWALGLLAGVVLGGAARKRLRA